MLPMFLFAFPAQLDLPLQAVQEEEAKASLWLFI